MLIPLGVDVPINRLPIANWVLIVLICCTTFVSWAKPEVYDALSGIRYPQSFDASSPEDVQQWTEEQRELIEDVVAQAARAFGRPVFDPPTWKLPILAVTSSFLHAGWLHLIGNMWFLLLFGNAVNYKFGNVLYLAMFFAAAFASGMVFYWTVPGTAVVGASGAIMAVVGAYLVFFPRNDVAMVFLWIYEGRTFDVSGWIVILFWFGFDVLYLLLGVQTGVAYAGHVTGFLTGLVIALPLAWFRVLCPTRYEQTLLQVLGIH